MRRCGCNLTTPASLSLSLALSSSGILSLVSFLRATQATLPVSLRADVIGLVRKHLIGTNVKPKQKKNTTRVTVAPQFNASVVNSKTGSAYK